MTKMKQEWEEEYDKQFYSNSDKTCTWHRNLELKLFIRSQILQAKREEVVKKLKDGKYEKNREFNHRKILKPI